MAQAATQLDRIEARLSEIACLLTILVNQDRSDRDAAERSRRLESVARRRAALHRKPGASYAA